MSRFFKSAAFPILIVVVLAFFAQRLINPGDSEKAPNYGQFLTLVDEGKIESATLNTKDNSIDFTEASRAGRREEEQVHHRLPGQHRAAARRSARARRTSAST